MSRIKKQKNISKYESEAIRIVDAEVQAIELQNEVVNEKYKTVFRVKTKLVEAGRMCICWGRTTFQVGDLITAKGRMLKKNPDSEALSPEDVFLCWTLNYRRGEKCN